MALAYIGVCFGGPGQLVTNPFSLPKWISISGVHLGLFGGIGNCEIIFAGV